MVGGEGDDDMGFFVWAAREREVVALGMMAGDGYRCAMRAMEAIGSSGSMWAWSTVSGSCIRLWHSDNTRKGCALRNCCCQYSSPEDVPVEASLGDQLITIPGIRIAEENKRYPILPHEAHA